MPYMSHVEFTQLFGLPLTARTSSGRLEAVKRFLTAGVGLATLVFHLSTADAQPMEVRNDSIQVDSEAYLSCGFCAGEKFGALFYAPVLPATTFPLTLSKIKIALASVNVVQDGGGFRCEPGQPGSLMTNYEIYAGTTVPSNINMLPQNGIWPGETVLMPLTQSPPITLSEPTTPGGSDYRLTLNEIPINGVTVAPPNTYIRVVVTIPTGPIQSASCSVLSLPPPGGVAFRDTDITGNSRRNFIYQIDPTGIVGNRWVFNESFQDPVTGMNINGDWIIRLEVESTSGSSPNDGGTSIGGDAAPNDPPDSGSSPADTGPLPQSDSGTSPAGDAGSGTFSPPPNITAITPSEGAFNTNIPVVIIGTGFAAGASARLGQIPMIGIEVAGATTIKAIIPPAISAGVYDVVVENPDGQIDFLEKGFAITSGTNVKQGTPPAESNCGCQTQANERTDFAANLMGLVLASAILIRRRRNRRS